MPLKRTILCQGYSRLIPSHLPALSATAMSPDLARSTYIRPKLNLGNIDHDGAVKSLPDLIEFNAVNNPHLLFGVQYADRQDVSPCDITFSQLQTAIEYASFWLVQTSCTNGRLQRQDFVRPVGIMLGSDISIFIYIAALLRIGTPVGIICSRCEIISVPIYCRDKSGSTSLSALDACSDCAPPHENLPVMCFDQYTYVMAVK